MYLHGGYIRYTFSCDSNIHPHNVLSIFNKIVDGCPFSSACPRKDIWILAVLFVSYYFVKATLKLFKLIKLESTYIDIHEM